MKNQIIAYVSHQNEKFERETVTFKKKLKKENIKEYVLGMKKKRKIDTRVRRHTSITML